jgi:mRNA interferase RelE/StbE
LGYSVVWHEKALDDLKAVDRLTAGKIVDRVKAHLPEDPGKLCKPLKGVLKGLYRYRWGDFRIIFAIDRAESLIRILRVGHRKSVYR